MRTKGLGWTQFEPKWSFDEDAREAMIRAWRKLLMDDIFPHEITMAQQKQLPKAAVPPQLG
eukprot:1843755-Prymnesium_polylepis.1